MCGELGMHIGLTTAVLLASSGFKVFGVDLNAHAVETINQGCIHIAELGLDVFVRSAVTYGLLKDYAKPRPTDIYLICVPTPFHAVDELPQPNIEFVLAATLSVAEFVKPGDLVIFESTSPVGTSLQMADVLTQVGVNVTNSYCLLPRARAPTKDHERRIRIKKKIGVGC